MIYLVSEVPSRHNAADGQGRIPLAIKVTGYFRSRGEAELAAREVAKSQPGKVFAVFTPGDAFEAREPEVSEKSFSNTGELIPKVPNV